MTSSMCDDAVVQSALKKWCNSVMKKTKRSSFGVPHRGMNLLQHEGYRALLHAMDVEVCMGRTSISRKTKVSLRYIRSVWTEEMEKEVNVWALKDINRVVEMKAYFYERKYKFDMYQMSYFDWVLKMGDSNAPFHGKYLPTYEEMKSGLGVDYAFKPNPKRIKMVDERQRICLSNMLYNDLGMTSGFVPVVPVYNHKTVPSTRSCCSSRPVVVKYSAVPDFDEKLEESKRQYLKRKEIQHEQYLKEHVSKVRSISSSSYFIEELSKKERSMSDSSEDIEEEKKCCHEDLKFGMRDQQMIHHSFCEEFNNDEYDSEATLKDAERLWFISNIPELEVEHKWLDAKVRRSMTDFYSFDYCECCTESYVILNYMKMRSHAYKFFHYADVPKKIVDIMGRFCSYTCFYTFVLSQAAYERDQYLSLTHLERTFCAFCNKSTYSYSECGNTWRKVQFFGHNGESEILAFCSDDCFIYFDRRHNDRKLLAKLGGQTVATFSFFTCFSCSKILLPSETIVHFRNFPRIAWAFCCYEENCIANTLKVSIPTNPLHDNYFMSSSVPVPFDRIDGLESHDPQVYVTLRALKVKEMSSCSGGRFILTILE